MKMLCSLLLLAFFVYNCESYQPFCPCNWEFSHGHCYYLSAKQEDFCFAQAYCQAHNGYLVKIETKAESDRVKQLAKYFSQKHAHAKAHGFWIGATDRAAEGKWRWVADGKGLTFKDWSPRQPDNFGKKEHCAQMLSERQGFKWNDNRCEQRFHFICETNSFGVKPCTCIKP